MIFKCYLCQTYHFWNKKKHYTVIGTNSLGMGVLERRICEKCGDQLNKQYDAGKALADMEISEENEE